MSPESVALTPPPKANGLILNLSPLPSVKTQPSASSVKALPSADHPIALIVPVVAAWGVPSDSPHSDCQLSSFHWLPSHGSSDHFSSELGTSCQPSSVHDSSMLLVLFGHGELQELPW